MKLNVPRLLITLLIVIALAASATWLVRVLTSKPIATPESSDNPSITKQEASALIRATVLEAGETEINRNLGQLASYLQPVKVRILSGIYKDLEIDSTFDRNHLFNDKYLARELRAGDEVLLHVERDKYGGIAKSYVTQISRDRYLVLLFGAFCLVLLLVGRMKGVKAIVSLIITTLSVIYFLIPMILKGHPPVLISILVCVFVIVVSLLIISGPSKKTLAAIIGTTGGVILAGILAAIAGSMMELTGLIDEEARMLIYIPQQVSLDFKGLLFAGVLIATMGATMDVGMAVASSMTEVLAANPAISRRELYHSGMNVGRDSMATMANTLILAYAGASLNLMLLFTAYQTPLVNFMNWESISTEMMRALTASTGLVLAIPFTAIVASYLFQPHDAPRNMSKRS
ncbi:MAG: YibE/F family protein [Bacillota bacterium]|nr:YibE/F family protein [Bacillota bacterium]